MTAMINTTPTGVRSAGFTLIEIMVALIVLTAVVSIVPSTWMLHSVAEISSK